MGVTILRKSYYRINSIRTSTQALLASTFHRYCMNPAAAYSNNADCSWRGCLKILCKHCTYIAIVTVKILIMNNQWYSASPLPFVMNQNPQQFAGTYKSNYHFISELATRSKKSYITYPACSMIDPDYTFEAAGIMFLVDSLS